MAKTSEKRPKQRSVKAQNSDTPNTNPARRGSAPSKLDTILTLLHRANGASIIELTNKTGWQPHSVRAALTRLRQRDIAIERSSKAGVTRYRVASS